MTSSHVHGSGAAGSFKNASSPHPLLLNRDMSRSTGDE